MTSAVPTLGYPSRSEACRALNARGLSVRQIVAAFADGGHKITPSQVSGLLSYTKRRGEFRRLTVSPDTLQALQRHACQRGLTPCELVERLLEAIAEDDMVDAVLDDQPEMKPRKEITHG
ncbi:MAG: hypothetical protein ACK4HW_08400 [Roseinatronobacter sp.]